MQATLGILHCAALCGVLAVSSVSQSVLVAAEPAARSVDAAQSGTASSQQAGSLDQKKTAETAPFETLTLRGQVRFLGPELEERYGIDVVPESAERQLVLDVPGGDLVPLVEDIRGRAFRADERLRNRDVELLVRRYRHSPFAQVINLSFINKDGVFVADYWCDVCTIAMYELKPCDCCQAPNRLRLRRVTPEGIADEELEQQP